MALMNLKRGLAGPAVGARESDNSNLKEAGVDVQHTGTVGQTHPHRVDGEEGRE